MNRDRQLSNALAVVGAIILAALFACIGVARADDGASLSVGIIGVDNSLGYDSPYLGAVVAADYTGDVLSCRGEAQALDAQKIYAEDGFGLNAVALCGARFGWFEAMAGGYWARQESDGAAKDSSAPRLEFGIHRGDFRFVGIYQPHGTEEIDKVYGVRVESRKVVSLLAEWTRVELGSRYSGQDGDRVSLAVLWRFGNA